MLSGSRSHRNLVCVCAYPSVQGEEPAGVTEESFLQEVGPELVARAREGWEGRWEEPESPS